MSTSYDVRIWTTEVYQGKTKTTYYVRWKVGKQKPFKKPFKTAALADSFRSDLVAAARKGEAFRLIDGLPVSMARVENEMSWYDFACAYAEMKWDGAAGNSRKGVAETLVTVTPMMLATKRRKPDDKVLRHGLNQWAFNLGRRDTVDAPENVKTALKWLAMNTRPVSTLAEPGEMRTMLNLMARKLDGNRAAASVIKRKRAVLYNVMEYAVELKLLSSNPIPGLKWKTPKQVKAIDKRSVVNHRQAGALLDAVEAQQPSGPRLKTFFAAMYYSALRPGEAANLRTANVMLPDLVWNSQTEAWEEPKDDWGSFCCPNRRRRRVPHGAAPASVGTAGNSSTGPKGRRVRSRSRRR